MAADYKYLWAKKEEKNGTYYWLPLYVHLNDTALVAGWLFNHWISGGQRDYLIGQMKLNNKGIDAELAEAVVRFLGAVHDIGKATPAFQVQKGYSCSPDLDLMLLEQLEKAGFTGIADIVLADPDKTRHAAAGEVILHNRFGIRNDIASIVGAHHGKPVDDDMLYRTQLAYLANYYQSEDPSSLVAEKWKNAQNDIFYLALNLAGISHADLPEISQPGQVILSGMIIMADWIASNEYYFPLLPYSDTWTKSVPDETERFRNGMQKWFFGLPYELRKPLSVNQLYSQRFGFTPSGIQKAIFQSLDNLSDPGIVVIEAPTGCGKTEAALAAAEQLGAIDNRSGLFFGLPTQATSDGIFDRVLRWTEDIAGDYGNASIHLVHGKAAMNPTFSKLKNMRYASSVDTDEDSYGTVGVNEWFSGRKTSSLDDFVVGTVDQFLMMALKQKHFALRHLGFSRKVVIVDEVHAYDAYMQQYLKEALRWAGAYRVPVILLSATLSSGIRTGLIEAYMKGRGIKASVLEEQRRKDCHTYPMLTVSDGECVKRFTDFPIMKNRRVSIKTVEEDSCIDLIGKLIEHGGIVGVIVNTVRRAQYLAEKCAEKFGREEVELIHASFIATDRSEKEQRLLKMIGKGALRPQRKLIIGTQVLEQSLDIDFDVLITDLCPIDLLIQRIGRLQRHDISRPEAHRTPVVYVMGESLEWDFEEGSARIYSKYLLARTQSVLPETISVPGDVSSLVERVYDSDRWEDLDADPCLKEKYKEIRNLFNDRRIQEEKKADVYRMNDPKKIIRPEKNNLIGMLKTDLKSDSEEMAYAQVRDTQETIEVIAVRQEGEGYGTFHTHEDISQRIHEPGIAQMIARETIRLPLAITAYGQAGKIIRELEEYNRRYLLSWQAQSWLKGSLGIIFDRDNSYRIGGKILKYDSFMGLQVFQEEAT